MKETESHAPTEPEPLSDHQARPRLRLFGIVMWSSLLGAIVILNAALALLPEEFTQDVDIGTASIGFFLCWALALFPALLAGVLTQRGPLRRPDPRRGGHH